MNTRPNIFDYATKELSQDAMVCWLLECYHSDNDLYRKVGLDFIKLVLGDDSLTFDDVELEKNSPHVQYYRMDVYANIRVRDKIIPVIFEDKTNTYLHGEQHFKYCKKVDGWKKDSRWKNSLFDNAEELDWGDIVFVFYKTGFVFDWQKKDLEDIRLQLAEYNAVVRTLYAEDLLAFAEKTAEADALVNDYRLYLKKQVSMLNNSAVSKYNRYFKKIIGENKWFNYSYQDWASSDIGIIGHISKYGENNIYCTLRMGWWKKGDGYKLAIAFQEYRNEKNITGDKKALTNERREVTRLIRDICAEIFEKLGKTDMLRLEYNDKNKMPDQNNIFRIFIDDGNEDEVCDTLGLFVEKFRQKAKAQFELFEEVI